MFKTTPVSKYAYIYVAQPLKESTPSFCLACIGTDNRFTGDEILKRWNYILQEAQKCDIQVVSFSADGDSRLMRAMRVALSMVTKDPILSLNINKAQCTEVPEKYHHWMCMKTLPNVFLRSRYCASRCENEMSNVETVYFTTIGFIFS